MIRPMRPIPVCKENFGDIVQMIMKANGDGTKVTVSAGKMFIFNTNKGVWKKMLPSGDQYVDEIQVVKDLRTAYEYGAVSVTSKSKKELEEDIDYLVEQMRNDKVETIDMEYVTDNHVWYKNTFEYIGGKYWEYHTSIVDDEIGNLQDGFGLYTSSVVLILKKAKGNILNGYYKIDVRYKK